MLTVKELKISKIMEQEHVNSPASSVALMFGFCLVHGVLPDDASFQRLL